MTTMSTVQTRDLAAGQVHQAIARHMLADGFEFVLDLTQSCGTTLVDARDGSSYLDLFTFFASSALGMNHPALVSAEAQREFATVAANKPSNSDVYSVPMARFVETFARVLGDPALPHLFFIDGGALAVENALKVAFDWKSRRNQAAGIDAALGTRVLHLERAFHGRSGYTMSLTNTEPNKTDRYPKFDWPRIPSPSINGSTDVVAAERAAAMGEHRLAGLRDIASRQPAVSDVRGRGLMCAITLPSSELRNEVVTRLRTDERVLMLACGPASLRVRPALTVTEDELDRGLAALDRVLAAAGS
jgi:4-aminobutyrate aminotransferase-like enzyme